LDAEYSRTFMRLACAYLEGKTVQAVTAQELNKASGGNAWGQAVTPSDASLHDTPPGTPSRSARPRPCPRTSYRVRLEQAESTMCAVDVVWTFATVLL